MSKQRRSNKKDNQDYADAENGKPSKSSKKEKKYKEDGCEEPVEPVEPCTWEDNFCLKGVPEKVLDKFFGHFCNNHQKAMSMLKGIKEETNKNQGANDVFYQYEKCSDAYTMIQFLTFMYQENAQFKALIDAFNENAHRLEEEDNKICTEDKATGSSQKPKKCVNNTEIILDGRSTECENPTCGTIDQPKNPGEILCANPKCDKNKLLPKKCRTYDADSFESLLETEIKKKEPGPVDKYFDCFSDEFCSNSMCYPCRFNVNDDKIKEYVKEFLESIKDNPPEENIDKPANLDQPVNVTNTTEGETPPQDTISTKSNKSSSSTKSKASTCKCAAFRQFFVEKKKKEEWNIKVEEAIACCPCQQCPSKKEETIVTENGIEQKPPKACSECCAPCDDKIEAPTPKEELKKTCAALVDAMESVKNKDNSTAASSFYTSTLQDTSTNTRDKKRNKSPRRRQSFNDTQCKPNCKNSSCNTHSPTRASFTEMDLECFRPRNYREDRSFR